MAVSLVASNRFTSDTSFDLGGSNSQVVVFAFTLDSTAPTFNGVAFTQIFGPFTANVYVWQLKNPASGSNAFVRGGSSGEARVYSFSGVDTLNPIDTFQDSIGSNVHAINIQPSVNGGILLNTMIANGTGTITPTSSQANILNAGAGDFWETDTQVSPGAGNTVGVTYSLPNSTPYTIWTAAIMPASATTTSTTITTSSTTTTSSSSSSSTTTTSSSTTTTHTSSTSLSTSSTTTHTLSSSTTLTSPYGSTETKSKDFIGRTREH